MPKKDTSKADTKTTKGASRKTTKASATENVAKTGVQLLVDEMLQSYVKLPMLDMVADRFVRNTAHSLRNHTSETINVEILDIYPIKFGDYIEALPNPSMIAIFKALEWGNSGLLLLNNELLYNFVEVLLGGKKVDSDLKVIGRAFTSIEYSIAQGIVDVVLENLTLSFEPITVVNFHMEQIESNPRFASIVRPEDAAIVLRFGINIEGKSGLIEIVLPYATIEPVKKILSQAYVGGNTSRDPVWSKHLETEINKSIVTISATYEHTTTKLADVANLKVGDTITLDNKVTDPVELKINGVKVGVGELGKLSDNVSVKLSDTINVKRYEDS